jgi:quinol monooxygenase YgiN
MFHGRKYGDGRREARSGGPWSEALWREAGTRHILIAIVVAEVYMLVWFVRCRAQPGRGAELLAHTIDNARASNREPGVARFDVLRDPADPDRLVIVEAYRDAEAPALHKETAHYKAWAAAVEPLLAEPRTKEAYESAWLPERVLAGGKP